MALRLLVALSVRNLLRHRRRNLLLLTAICVAVGGVIVMNALMRGMQQDMRDAAVDNLTGHLKLLAPGYRDDPGIEHAFALAPGWQPEVNGDDLVGWAPRVRVPAVIMSERETRGVQLVGIDPAREHISFLERVPVDGERLAGAGDGRLLIGRDLAERLQTDVGYRLVVITQGADGRNREAGFRVAGIFHGEGAGLERAFAFTGMGHLQALLDVSGVTEVSVRLTGDANLEPARVGLGAARTDVDVLTWQTLEPQAATMFAWADVAIYIWFVILMGALIFGLVNALVTAVMERTRELGMLRALGMRRAAVVVQVVLESCLVMAVGVLAGLLLGFAAIHLLADGIDLSRWAEGVELARMRSRLVPVLLARDVLLVALMSLAFGVLASLYPAWQAVKIEPLEALRR